jgi:hypothetical protein
MLTIEQKRTAIEQAINQIARPGAYDFSKLSIPESEARTGCVLGWIGFYAQHIDSTITRISDVSQDLMGGPSGWTDSGFYDAMDAVQQRLRADGTLAVYDPSEVWTSNAAIASIVLREWLWSHPDLSPSWITDRGPVDAAPPAP